jgi:hypothetical protein
VGVGGRRRDKMKWKNGKGRSEVGKKGTVNNTCTGNTQQQCL